MAANNFAFAYPPQAAPPPPPQQPPQAQAQPQQPQQPQQQQPAAAQPPPAAYAQPPPPQPPQPAYAYNVAYSASPYPHAQQAATAPPPQQPAAQATYAATYTSYPAAAAPAAAAPAAPTAYYQQQQAQQQPAQPPATYAAYPTAVAAAPRPTYSAPPAPGVTYAPSYTTATYQAAPTAVPKQQTAAQPMYISQTPSNLTQVPTGPHIPTPAAKPVAPPPQAWASRPPTKPQYAAAPVPAPVCQPPPPHQPQPQAQPPPQHLQQVQLRSYPAQQSQQPPQPQSAPAKVRPAPKPQQLHYCEVCKISCAGPQTYKEHLEGQKHKKKEAAARSGQPGPTTRCGNALRCELCDVTCTGSDAYAAHIRGAKHQKVVKLHTKLGKPIPSVDPIVVSHNPKEDEAAGKAGDKDAKKQQQHSSSKSGHSAAQIHIQGSPIQTVVQKAPQPYSAMQQAQHHPHHAQAQHHSHQQREHSSKPPPPKITFVAAKGDSAAKQQDSAASATSSSSHHNPVEVTIPRLPEEKDVQPVGHDYIEEVKNDEGKTVSFNCRLCDCRFNDPNAKEMHMKGRKHRLQYKKKVNPDLVVDVKPSLRQRKMAEEREKRVRAREEFWRRREEEFKLMEEEEKTYWGERRGRFDEGESQDFYTASVRGRGRGGRGGGAGAGGGGGPMPPMGPFGFPPMLRRPDTIDDRHIMFKHSEIYPEEEVLEEIQKTVSVTEKALKNVSDILVEEEKTPKGRKETEEKEEERDSEDGGPDRKKKMKKEPNAEPAATATPSEKQKVRILKGVMKVGVLAKGLLLKGDTAVELVVLCGEKPTRKILAAIVEHLPEQLKAVTSSEVVEGSSEAKFVVKEFAKQGCFTVTKETGIKVEVTVSLTSPLVREEGAGGGTDEVKEEAKEAEQDASSRDCLPLSHCLSALASVRHAKWFQARASGRQSCVIIIRILRDFARRSPVWQNLSLFALELLVEKVLFSAGLPMSPGDALRRVFEALAGGLLLTPSPGLLDPCEKEPSDAAGNLTPQEREDITLSAQNALRSIAFRQVNKVLAIDALPPAKFCRGGRFTRKRRRDDDPENAESGAENEDDGVVNEKKDKKETLAQAKEKDGEEERG